MTRPSLRGLERIMVVKSREKLKCFLHCPLVVALDA
jgi:hypothetical protein